MRWPSFWGSQRKPASAWPYAAGEDPLRAELLNAEQMEERGRELSREHEARTSRRTANPLLQRLGQNADVIRGCCRLLAQAIKDKHKVTPAGEWLLDNLYLIDEQIRTARRHLPRRYSWQLPLLDKGPSAGLPRVYDIALKAISHGDGRFDEESLRRFVAAYQEAVSLTLGELWAIPIVLRLALVENLRRVAYSVRSDRIDRNVAIRWADSLIEVSRSDPTSLILVAADMARERPSLSSSFVSELERRLQPLGEALSLPLTWIDQRLAESGLSSIQLVQRAQHEQAADQVSVSNCIGSLRLLDALDWKSFVESVSTVESILRRDPSGVYPRMNFTTRDMYRHVVERIAREAGVAEVALASTVVEMNHESAGDDASVLSRHVGYYLIGDGHPDLRDRCGLKRRPVVAAPRRPGSASLPLYLLSLVALGIALLGPVLTHLLADDIAVWLKAIVLLLSSIGISQLVIALISRLSAFAVAPHPLPQLDFRKGIPPEAMTLVAIPTLLSDVAATRRLVDDLEVRYLANRDEHIHFALLTDFADASEAVLPSDGDVLEAAVEGIEGLNARYQNDRFFLLHRPRQWNEREGAWMGSERKRGKLADLNALLRRNGGDRFSKIVGNPDLLHGTRYVITLDSDSQLPRDSARELIETMEHLLNRPRFDENLNLVVGGYGILQPRITSALPQGGMSSYARLFGGDAGIDPYTRAVSDTYQDLFGEGSFIGKGIYDVDAFERVTEGRFPDNRILSHDLLEGCYARSGLASGIELYEVYPQTYLADAKRRHRWMRGDWQIAEWLFPYVPTGNGERARNPLSALSRWKILDNLRRSLVPIALLALLLIGWLWLPSPAFWTALVVEILIVATVVDLGLAVAGPREESSIFERLKGLLGDAAHRLAQIVVSAALLPFEAWLSLDAIARTYWRVHVSCRHLLQWTVSSSVQSRDRNHLGSSIAAMWIAPAASIVIGLCLLHRDSFLLALPWLVAWLASPILVWLLSDAPSRRAQTLAPTQVLFLRGVARRTWNFFEHFVGAEDHWLPPDNYQEHPIPKIAHRTSPTNIGLYLLSTLAAHDLGYLSLSELIERLSCTLETLERLPRHHGHFYNWYSTTTLQPLAPLYVSTVDSGNLIAHLLTLRQGLLARRNAPVAKPSTIFAGLRDALSVAAESDPQPVHERWTSLALLLDEQESLAPRTAGELVAMLTALDEKLGGMREPTTDRTFDTALEMHRRIRAAVADIEIFFGPAKADTGSMTRDLASTLLDLGSLCGREPVGGTGPSPASAACDALETLAARCAELAHVDFDFLYDENRSLFTIGYNVTERRRDAGFYDLLASEARLGVFVAIAQGKVAQDTWFSLGRLLTRTAGRQVLLSWSGSMFEYLMPQLVMPSFPGTLLDETFRSAVAGQMAYAHSKHVAWGISESGYNMTDAAQNYQYRAFGVPGLGLQRGLAQDLVIAPYASTLALTVLPSDAERNLRMLADSGWLTPFGYYEAIDYTSERVPPGETCAIVRSFMAHHHGMTLLAVAHAVLDRPMQKRFAADPQLKATMLLLQERTPRSVINWSSNPAMVDVRSAEEAPQAAVRVFTQADTRRPAVQLLTNGRYQVMVTNNGGGYSRWHDLAVTRWREDATRDPWGVFCYLRDVEASKIWSTTPAPMATAVDASEAIFTESSVEFRRRLDDVEAHTQIVVSPEDDIELRRIRITNRSRAARTIEVTSYAEVVLSSGIADSLHPAFGNLFVQTEVLSDRDSILATRRARTGEDPQRWMMHLLALHGGESQRTSFETDRLRFLGRNNGIGSAAAAHSADDLSGTCGSVLDPIVSIRQRVLRCSIAF